MWPTGESGWPIWLHPVPRCEAFSPLELPARAPIASGFDDAFAEATEFVVGDLIEARAKNSTAADLWSRLLDRFQDASEAVGQDTPVAAFRAIQRLRDAAGRAGPTRLPAVERRPALHHGYGRPRRSDLHPGFDVSVAWALDIGGWGERLLGRRLDGVARRRQGEPEDERARSGIRRARRSGRAYLHELGVVPWAGWGQGTLPADWWLTPEFRKAITQWACEALRRQVGPEALKSLAPSIEQRLHDVREELGLAP